MNENQPTLWEQIDEKWLPFRQACEIVWDYEFEYRQEWELFIKGYLKNKTPLQENIPHNPKRIYKYLGWTDWENWLVHPSKRITYSNFFKARAFVRCLRLKNEKQYFDYISSNKNIHKKHKILLPKNPQYEYMNRGNNWISWKDWLGSNIDYKGYKETKSFVKSLKLKTKTDWIKYCKNKKPQSIYTYPEIAYKEWQGWNAWLGNDLFGNPKKKVFSDIPDGAKPCRCKGLDVNCIDCDGKAYYF